MSTSPFRNIDFDKWSTLSDGTVVLSQNAACIPRPVSRDEVPFPRADGSWGPHEISLLPQVYDPEHPYLGHILVGGHLHFKLPHAISRHIFRDSEFYRYPQLPRRGYIKRSVTLVWENEVCSYRQRVLRLYDLLQSVAPGPYKAPLIAVARAEDTLFIIQHNMMSYRDAVEYTRGLQRMVAEIQAFLIWGNRLTGRSLQESQPLRQCFRGAYVTSLADFSRLSADGIPVFYLTGLLPSNLPDTRWVRLTELTSLCEFRTWADFYVTGCNRDVVRGNLVHSKPLMFYPPHVDHSDLLTFERAARGYASRSDTQSFDRRILADAVSLRAQSPQSSMPRKPKTQESDWRRQTKSLRENWPAWGCDWDYIWHFHATGDGLPEHTTPDSPVPSHGAHFTYVVPPVHLLANVQTDDKRAKVFFTWICIRRIWILRYQHYRQNHSSQLVATTSNNSQPSPFHLHTQMWRDILSGQWWRRNCWPSQSNYEHRFFWRHGGTMLLGSSEEELARAQDDPTTAYYSVSNDLSPLLSPGRRLELKDFENKDLCNLVIYDLALLNHQLQFEETDDFLMHVDSIPLHDRHARLNARRDLFRSSLDIPKEAFAWHDTKWELSQHWKQAVPWYTRFRSLLATWPRNAGDDDIEWEKDLSDMGQWRFTDYCRRLSIFYRRSVMQVVGVAVAPLLRYPALGAVQKLFLSM